VRERNRRNQNLHHMPGPLAPTWSERRVAGDGGPPYRETLFPIWLISATVLALGALFDWRFVPAVIGFPVCMMATLGFFWMLASPRRPAPRGPARQTNRRSIRSRGASTPHRR
jgi:hypothetical protein